MFTTTEDMNLYGYRDLSWNAPHEKRDEVNKYKIVPETGIHKISEIVTEETFPKESTFRISKAMRCKYCIDQRVEYSIILLDPTLNTDQKPVYITELNSGDYSKILETKTTRTTYLPVE